MKRRCFYENILYRRGGGFNGARRAGVYRLRRAGAAANVSLPRAFDRLRALDREREKAVARAAEAVPGVESASCTIQDDNALIGLTLRGGMADNEIIALKQTVEKAAKAEDGKLAHAAVTITPELKQRIADLSGDGELEETPPPVSSDAQKTMEEFMTK